MRIRGVLGLSQTSEYIIDGNVVNKQLEPYNLEAHQPTSPFHQMLPSQVFEVIQKKFIKGVIDEIEKANPKVVRFVNLEAIATGPHRDYLYAICGGFRVLVDSLHAKGIEVAGTVQNPWILPWTLVSKIDKNFKGLPAHGEETPGVS